MYLVYRKESDKLKFEITFYLFTFVFAGVDDAVRCFFCDGGLRNWTPSDDPWVEHARWFPRCPYLQEEKGSDFVASILQRFPQTQHEVRCSY